MMKKTSKPHKASQLSMPKKVDLKDFRWQVWWPAMAVIVVVAVSLMGLLVPQVKEIMEMNKEIKRSQWEATGLQDKLSILNQQSEAELNSQVEVVERVLPSEKPVFSVLGIIQLQADATEVRIEGFDFNPGSLATESASLSRDTPTNKKKSQGDSKKTAAKEQPGKLATTDFEVMVAGTFGQIKDFTVALENSAPLMEVEKVMITNKTGREADEGLMQGSIALKVYYALPPRTIGKATDPIRRIVNDQVDVFERILLFKHTTGSEGAAIGQLEPRSDLFSF